MLVQRGSIAEWCTRRARDRSTNGTSSPLSQPRQKPSTRKKRHPSNNAYQSIRRHHRDSESTAIHCHGAAHCSHAHHCQAALLLPNCSKQRSGAAYEMTVGRGSGSGTSQDLQTLILNHRQKIKCAVDFVISREADNTQGASSVDLPIAYLASITNATYLRLRRARFPKRIKVRPSAGRTKGGHANAPQKVRGPIAEMLHQVARNKTKRASAEIYRSNDNVTLRPTRWRRKVDVVPIDGTMTYDFPIACGAMGEP